MDMKTMRAFRRNLRRFQRLNAIQEKHCCRKISVAQCHVLLEMEELGQTTTQELVARLLLDKSTLSRTIDSLVNRRLVKRLISPGDRRFTPLILTKAGESICETINRENDSFYRKIFDPMNPEEGKSMALHFEKLVQAFSGHLLEPPSDMEGHQSCCS